MTAGNLSPEPSQSMRARGSRTTSASVMRLRVFSSIILSAYGVLSDMLNMSLSSSWWCESSKERELHMKDTD